MKFSNFDITDVTMFDNVDSIGAMVLLFVYVGISIKCGESTIYILSNDAKLLK